VPGLTRLSRRAGRADRGAVTILVAILFSSGTLLGMTAYAVDLGTLYAYRDEAINAANAAAMAAAQTCVRPGARCGGVANSYAQENISTGGVVLNSNGTGDAACGLDKDGGQLSPCSDPPSGPKNCIGTRDDGTSWAEVHATTKMGDGSTVFPPTFAGAVVPGYRPDGVQACARVAWGVPQGPYNSFGMSLCAFKVLTDSMGIPYADSFHAVYDTTVDPTHELVLSLEDPIPPGGTDRCSDLGYYSSNGHCQIDTRQGRNEIGSTNNATSTVPLPDGCRALLNAKEKRPDRSDPRPYLLIPIYRNAVALSSSANTQFTSLYGVAAFQVTGDHLGDGTSNPKATGTPDWLTGVSESDYCHPGSTKPEDRCIRGYFLWVNIIDGTFPSRFWTHTLGVATFKTVG